MAVSSEYKDFLAEQLERLGPVRFRGMFGGAGIYLDDLMFGLIFDETLYFKVDDRNRADYEAEGMDPFTYEMSDGSTGSLRYYEVPERLYDDPGELVEWARKALEVMRGVRAEKLARAARAAERKKAAAGNKGNKGKKTPSAGTASSRKLAAKKSRSLSSRRGVRP